MGSSGFGLFVVYLDWRQTVATMKWFQNYKNPIFNFALLKEIYIKFYMFLLVLAYLSQPTLGSAVAH